MTSPWVAIPLGGSQCALKAQATGGWYSGRQIHRKATNVSWRHDSCHTFGANAHSACNWIRHPVILSQLVAECSFGDSPESLCSPTLSVQASSKYPSSNCAPILDSRVWHVVIGRPYCLAGTIFENGAAGYYQDDRLVYWLGCLRVIFELRPRDKIYEAEATVSRYRLVAFNEERSFVVYLIVPFAWLEVLDNNVYRSTTECIHTKIV